MCKPFNMPVSTSTPEKYLSLNQLAGQAGICNYTAKRLMDAGHITPDGFTGRTALFAASRFAELAKAIRANVIPYARNGDLGFFSDANHPLNLASNLHFQ